MKIFYTFSSDPNYPYHDGWVEVEAETIEQANAIFWTVYPDRNPGILNCAGCYTESEFVKTFMPKNGNFGVFCHERIKLCRETVTEAHES